jgi:phage regulator Rha-like protein
MFDFDLALLYEVETRVLNQAVKRNIDLFPKDFIFRLKPDEWNMMSSQIVMTYPEKRPKTAPPLAFTEHGVIMLANVLRSKKARQMSISVVRAFIAMKQYTSNFSELSDKIRELENRINKRFKDIYEAINYLLDKDRIDKDQKNRKPIGY